MVNKADIEKIYKQLKRKLDAQYSDKFIYALPNWFRLSAAPEVICVLPIHGKEGLAIARQKVEFKVDFSDKLSVSNYVDFLNKQMPKKLMVVAYVVFFNKNIQGGQDGNYKVPLTVFEEREIIKYNNHCIDIDISVAFFDVNFNEIASLDDVGLC